jgi:hypothetical protein
MSHRSVSATAEPAVKSSHVAAAAPKMVRRPHPLHEQMNQPARGPERRSMTGLRVNR